jgi:hypothetical protein
MNDAGHILMKQAYLLEISGGRKIYGEGYWRYSFYQSGVRCPGDVRELAGTAHDGRLWELRIRKLGTAGRTSYRLERRPGFGVGYECYGMDLVDVERPGDAVASMNPDFIRKKRQRLTSFVVTLSPHGSEPRLWRGLWCGRRAWGRPQHLRNDQDSK